MLNPSDDDIGYAWPMKVAYRMGLHRLSSGQEGALQGTGRRSRARHLDMELVVMRPDGHPGFYMHAPRPAAAVDALRRDTAADRQEEARGEVDHGRLRSRTLLLPSSSALLGI